MTNVKLFGNNFLRWACRRMEHDKMNSWKLLLHQHKKEFIELGITCPREVWGSWRQAETRVCLNDAGFLMCFDIKIQEPKLPWGVGALRYKHDGFILSNTQCSLNILTWLINSAVKGLPMKCFCFVLFLFLPTPPLSLGSSLCTRASPGALNGRGLIDLIPIFS